MKDGYGSGRRVVKTRQRRVLFIEENIDSTMGGSPRALLWIVQRMNREKYRPAVLFYRDNSMVPEFAKVCEVFVINRSAGLVFVRDVPRLGRLMAANRALEFVLRAVQAIFNFWVFTVPQQVRMHALFRRYRPDIVHLNNGPGSPDCLGLAKIYGAKLIAHYRGTVGLEALGRTDWLTRKVFWEICRRTDRIICISKAVEDVALTDNPGLTNLVRIYDGVDGDRVRALAQERPSAIRDEAGQPAGQPLVCLVNHIRPWKGQHVLVEAMGLLRDRVPEVKAVLVGDVSNLPADLAYYQGLRTRVQELGIVDRVFFAGYRVDAPAIFAASDIVVQTSIAKEGFGLVTVEAMALGKPVIGSAFGPTPELITHDVNGLLVPPNDPQALADAIERLVRHPADITRLGQAARARADEFSMQANVAAIERLYEELS